VSDDSFRLTPHDIRAQEFARTFRGYSPQQVDDFRQRVAEELDRLVRVRNEQEERLKIAQEQLRGFRERERAMNEALIAAQQLREDARAQMLREAELATREAQVEAERIVARAHLDERLVRERAEGAARQFAGYITGFRFLLERQLSELDVLQTHALDAPRDRAVLSAEASEVREA
jgi:DivIVA domain-containing protein